MENREQQILSEIKSMMASIRSQLELLDTKMAELQQVVDPEDFAAESIDLDIEVDETVETVVAEEVVVQEIPLEETVETPEAPDEEAVEIETAPETAAADDDDLPFGDLPAVEDLPVEEDLPSEDDFPAEEEQPSGDDLPEDDDLPCVFDEPEVVTVTPKSRTASKPTINDMMAADCAWKKDMPGTPVKDIRSAISLNDRVLFINLLFDEDAQAFVNALSRINTMETLDQAVDYISAEFPSWDMNSELVYRFMMAVRRKVK